MQRNKQVNEERDYRDMSVGERIRLIREINQMNQATFGEEISLSLTSVCQLEVGKYKMSRITKRVICERFNINPQWLETGEGEMYTAPEEVVNITGTLLSILNDNPALLNTVKRAIRMFSPNDWNKLNELMCLLQK